MPTILINMLNAYLYKEISSFKHLASVCWQIVGKNERAAIAALVNY